MIDLGHISAPEIPAWPSRRRRSGKGWLSAVLAVAVLLLLGAASSGRPDPMPFVTSLAVDPAAPLTIVGDSVFVLDTTSGRTRIQAYGLPAGRLLWTADVSGAATIGRILAIGSTIVVEAGMPDGQVHTIAGFDATTGHERWHMAAYDMTPDDSALFVWPPDENGRTGGFSLIDRVDPVTGRILWSSAIGDGCQTIFAGTDDMPETDLVELCTVDTDLSVLDLTTGRIRAHRRVDSGGKLDYGNISVQNGVIVLAGYQVQNIGVTAYRVSDLSPIWWTAVEVGSVLQGSCGPQVCAETPHGIVTLDLRTGAVVPTVVAPTTSPIGLHPRSGVLELLIVPASEDRAAPLAPFDVTLVSVVPSGGEVGIGGYEPGNGATTWITQQLGDGSYRQVGPLSGVGDACGFASTYVLCATAPKRITLWRLPPVS